MPIGSTLDRLKNALKHHSDRAHILIISVVGSMIFAAGLWRNSFAYTYYSAAAQAGTKSWKSFFFASIDAGNFMTVDKPPFAVWMSSLSARVFGVNPFAILMPHAIAGILTAIVIYKTVRITFDSQTSLLASSIFLITPAASVVFRFNMTDSFLVLFVVASIYCFLRALENSNFKWLIPCGLFLGLGFNTKMTQAFLVIPIYVVMYLFNSRKKLVVRMAHLTILGLVTIISSLWWVAIVSFVPKDQRPYIGSTTSNSIFELVFIHNGFGRLFGSNWVQATGSRAGVAFGGDPGPLRMFNTGFGPNFIWFFALAVVGVFAAIWAYRSSSRIIMIKNQIGIWFFFILINGLIYSFNEGTIHPYYAVMFAPGTSILAAIAISTLWSKEVINRDRLKMYHMFFVTSILTVCVFIPMYVLQDPLWTRLVGITTLTAGGILILLYGFAGVYSNVNHYRIFSILAISLLGFVCVCLTFANIFFVQHGFMATTQPQPESYQKFEKPLTTIPHKLQKFLTENQKGAKWIAASTSAIVSTPIQLSTGEPVIALGGFAGDNNPLTLQQFQQLVNEKQVRYYVVDKRQSQAFRSCNFESTGTNKGAKNTGCEGLFDERVPSTPAIELWVMSKTPIKSVSKGRWVVYDLW